MRLAALKGLRHSHRICCGLLVRKKGVAFRDAHEVVGLSVAYCIKHQKRSVSIGLWPKKLQQFQ